MTKHLYLAPAGGGKTSHMLDLARQAARSLQAEVRVCVPTGLQARAWQHRLAAAGGAVGVHVLTFDALVAACLAAAGEAYTELNEAVQYRLLRALIDRLPLEHYAPIKAKPGFVLAAHQLITELKSARIDPDAFTAATVQLGDEPRLRELADIYTVYQAQVLTKAWADRVGLHWLAVEALEQRAPRACRDWPQLIVDGFDDFTPAQLALLRVLANRAGAFTLTLPQAEGIDFPRYRKTRQNVEAALGVIGQPLPARREPLPPSALRDLARRLFAPYTGERIPAPGALTLVEAPDRAAEVRAALRWLKQQIRWEGAEPDQVALLTRDITPYRPFITQIAAEFGLPVRLEDGQPLAQNPAVAALLALMRLHLSGRPGGESELPRRGVVAAWRSPYFSWGSGPTAISSADADDLDRFARQQRVIRGLAQWVAAFEAALPARDESGRESEEEEVGGLLLAGAPAGQLSNKFTNFLALTRPPQATTFRDFVRWLEDLIGPDPLAPGTEQPAEGSLHIVAQARANPATAEADVAAFRALKDILRGLVWAEEAVGIGRRVDFPAFFAELAGAIAGARFILPARAGRPEIVVANVTQARGLRFTAAAIMGLSEGAFPAIMSEDPFLRDADRRALLEGFGFPLAPSTLSAEREFFYEGVTRAEERLLLTRPVLADNGADWVASPYWEAIRRLTGAAVVSIPSEATLGLAETASWAEWWEAAAALPDGAAHTQDLDAGTWDHIQAAARIWQSREVAETTAWDGDLSALAMSLADRYGPDHIWSATRLEAYRTCGFLFFLRHALGLEPRPEPVEGLDARQLGNLYHGILEDVVSRDLPDQLEEAALRHLVAEVAAPMLDAAPETEGFRETPWWAQTRQEILDNIVRAVLALSAGEYAFFQAEAAFGVGGPPLVIHEEGDRLQLRGFIDRVDRRTDGCIRIIDYKSGGKAAYTVPAFDRGKKLQLPLYALAAQETLGLGPVADGFYWHLLQAEPSSFQLTKATGGVEGAIETAVAHAWDAVHRIRDGQFTPQPPTEGCPDYCPAAGFCWQYRSRGW